MLTRYVINKDVKFISSWIKLIILRVPSSLTQDVNGKYIRQSKGVLDVF